MDNFSNALCVEPGIGSQAFVWESTQLVGKMAGRASGDEGGVKVHLRT